MTERDANRRVSDRRSRAVSRGHVASCQERAGFARIPHGRRKEQIQRNQREELLVKVDTHVTSAVITITY